MEEDAPRVICFPHFLQTGFLPGDLRDQGTEARAAQRNLKIWGWWVEKRVWGAAWARRMQAFWKSLSSPQMAPSKPLPHPHFLHKPLKERSSPQTGLLEDTPIQVHPPRKRTPKKASSYLCSGWKTAVDDMNTNSLRTSGSPKLCFTHSSRMSFTAGTSIPAHHHPVG